jgi:hypothetical protein
VGIGTAAPQAVLDITGSYTAAGEKVTGVRNKLTVNKQAGNAELYAESIEPVFTDPSGVKACLYIRPYSGSDNTALSGIRVEIPDGTSAQAIYTEANGSASCIVAVSNGSGIAVDGRGYGVGSVGGLFSCNVPNGYALKTTEGKVVFTNDVGIGVDPPTQKLDVFGNIKSSGNIYALGSISVGAASPNRKLDVVGGQFGVTPVLGSPGVITALPSGNGSWWNIANTNNGAKFVIEHGDKRNANDTTDWNSSKLTIQSDGCIGIGTPSPATSALLDLSSINKALLVTRLTTGQRDSLTAVNGMIIYNTTTNTFQGRANGVWVNL